MKLIFVDETQNKRHPQFYGVCGVSIDEIHYPQVARKVEESFRQSGWDPENEFKGSCLFSVSKGDKDVLVEKRIELADKLIAINVAKKNARMSAAFAWNHGGDRSDNHLFLLSHVLNKLLQSQAARKTPKPCVVFADRNGKISLNEQRKAVRSILDNKNHCLVEDVNILQGWHPTQVGLCLCDLIAYLASWKCTTSDDGEAQKSLFEQENISQFDLQKAKTVTGIFNNLKKVCIVNVEARGQATPLVRVPTKRPRHGAKSSD